MKSPLKFDLLSNSKLVIRKKSLHPMSQKISLGGYKFGTSRLSADEVLNPFSVLQDYCIENELGELKNRFLKVIETCMLEDDIFNNPENRAQLWNWYKNTEKVIEAIFELTKSKMFASR
ncbi:MAG TPA: hypothetical protein VK543_09940 [Puia sp.]|nr:hypothetical protein [Puia sp.]